MNVATITQIVNEVLQDIGDFHRSRYARIENYAFRCLQKFELDKSTTIISKVFTLSNISTLDYGSITDYVDWIKIGTIKGDRLKLFTYNDRIINYHPLVNGVEQPNQTYTDTRYGLMNQDADMDGVYFNNTWLGGRFVGTFYGEGNGSEWNQGQFDEDRVNKRLQFSTEWANKEVLLEYVTTGIQPTGTTYVPEYCRLMFVYFIKWHYYLDKKELAMAREFERLFNLEDSLVGRRVINLSPQDVHAIAMNSYMGVPKT